MKKFTTITLVFFLLLNVQAQNYLISFSGSGESTSVEYVEVLNIEKELILTINGTDTLLLDDANALNDNNYYMDTKLMVYPNPANENCSVGFYNTKQGVVLVEIIDIAGKLILSKSLELSQGNHTLSLDGLKPGVSFIKVRTLEQNLSARLVSMAKNDCSKATIELKESNTSNNYLKDSRRTEKGIVQMQYNHGDPLFFKGCSETLSTIVALVPNANKNIEFKFAACSDYDNNHYSVVSIGNQIWMAENLKTTTYRNGEPIPLVTGNSEWYNLSTPAYCWQNNDIANKPIYGALYNWYAVSTGNLCPTGWHVPNNSEWYFLVNYVDPTHIYPYTQGCRGTDGSTKLRSYNGWYADNRGADKYGFSALPGGDRGNGFSFVLRSGFWWCSTAFDAEKAWRWELYMSIPTACSDVWYKNMGYSVRCVKDN